MCIHYWDGGNIEFCDEHIIDYYNKLKILKILSSYIALEEHESEVLQVECSIQCSLLGEQEQSHSAGTDIIIIDYRRRYLLWKIIIYMKQFLETDFLRAVQILVNTVQKWGNIMQKNKKKLFSENEKMWLANINNRNISEPIWCHNLLVTPWEARQVTWSLRVEK